MMLKVFNSLKNNLLLLYFDTKILLNSYNKILLWFLILPFTFLFYIIVVFFSIFFYFFFIFFLFFKCIVIFFNPNKNIISKININFEFLNNVNNVYFIFFKQILIDQSLMKSFLIFYKQLEFFKNFFKNTPTGLNYTVFFENLMFRYIFFNLTSIPLIVFKNNNYILNNILIVFKFKKTSFFVKIKTLLYNLIIKYNSELIIKSKNLNIILSKNSIILNFKKEELEILKNLSDINLWVSASNKLMEHGLFSQMRYFTYNDSYIPFHPTLSFRNNLDNKFFIVNQSTQNSIKVLEDYNNYKKNEVISYIKKKELELKTQAILKDKNAYLVMPHLVDEEDVILGDPTQLIRELNNKEKFITKFSFIQSFFINLELELFKYDSKTGLLVDKNYKTAKEYLILNHLNFDNNIKNEFLKLIEFHEKNKNFLFNNRISFIEILNKANFDVDVKNYFLKIIEQYLD